MAKLGKRTKAIRAAAAGKENLSIEDAVSLVKSNAELECHRFQEQRFKLNWTRTSTTFTHPSTSHQNFGPYQVEMVLGNASQRENTYGPYVLFEANAKTQSFKNPRTS